MGEQMGRGRIAVLLIMFLAIDAHGQKPTNTISVTADYKLYAAQESFSVSSYQASISSETQISSSQSSSSSVESYEAASTTTQPKVTPSLPKKVGRYRPEDIADAWAKAKNHTPPTTTTQPNLSICGGTDLFCSVEFDANGDRQPECCNSDNNPVCGRCLDYCIDYCARDYVGVMTCFAGNNTKPFCQCSTVMPVCYKLKATTTTMPPTTTGNNTTTYLAFFGVTLLILTALVKFTHKVF